MPRMATSATRIARVRENYERLLIACCEVIANPTQAAVDALVDAGSTSGLLNFSLDHSLDGESYNWVGYQTFLIDQIEKLKALETRLAGPYDVRSRAVSW